LVSFHSQEFHSVSAYISGHLIILNFTRELIMSTKDTLENIARNTWLAGLGYIDSSKEALSKSIDAAQEKSNNLYSELLTRGEEIQGKINDTKGDIQGKINDTKDDIHAKGKQFFGINTKVSHEEKLAQLNAAVDQLTSVIVKLVEVRNAEALVIKLAPKVEAEPKVIATAKPTETVKKPAPTETVAKATKQAETATKATKQTKTKHKKRS
jgi:hypothetical protein